MSIRVVNCWRAGTSDPHLSSVKLLLSMDGANGSTTFTDESPAARGNAIVTGDAQVSTALKKFGTGSLRLDGATDDIKYDDHADWTLGTSDFTIEGWFSYDTTWLETTSCLVSHYAVAANQRGWRLDYRGGDATNVLRFVGSSDGITPVTIVEGNWTPSADTFYHTVIERSGNTFRLYVNGTMLASATSAISFFNSTHRMIIGETADPSEPYKGNVDEFRFTLGVARYASDSGYSVPVAAFPRS